MGTTDTFSDLSVSLEPHLLDVLRPLPPLLPSDLSDSLSHHLRFGTVDDAPLPPSARQPASLSTSSSSSSSSSPSLVATSPKAPVRTPTVPYTVLLSISKWSHTSAGARALSRHSPPLDAQTYSMVALLAGTRTSPNRKFPDMKGKLFDPVRDARREVNDKRAIIAVLNALLSVGGAGAATWVAAQRTGWRDEWKVLFSFLAATVVAVSEIVLYMIWESRRSKSAMRSKGRPNLASGRMKRHDGTDSNSPDSISQAVAIASRTMTSADDQSQPDGLRRRHAGPGHTQAKTD